MSRIERRCCRSRPAYIQRTKMAETKSASGSIAVVTGGGRGIGAAIAAKLAELGYSLVVCGRTRGPLEDTAQRLPAAGHKCEPLECDVSNLQSVEKLAAAVGQRL